MAGEKALELLSTANQCMENEPMSNSTALM